MQQVMPHNLTRVKLYSEDVPLFTRFQIEHQIEAAYQHDIRLPSGGSIVIDHTEAMVSIDINSSRATKGGDIEETALSTNLEAADEIARQLRLRDIGGLVVIDFIDMTPVKNQREVENRLREALKSDRARIQVGRISRFGLLEMSRQRLQPSLGESAHETCPRCNGLGVVRSVESLALSILRIIEEGAMKDGTAQVIAQLPVNVATYLLNEKRNAVSAIEKRQQVQILLIANSTLETPNYEVKRIRLDEIRGKTEISYHLATDFDHLDDDAITPSTARNPAPEQPAVRSFVPSTPAPASRQEQQPTTPANEGGFIKQIFTSLFRASAGNNQPEQNAATEQPATETPSARAETERSQERNRPRRKNNERRQGKGNRGKGKGQSQAKTEQQGANTAATTDASPSQGQQAATEENASETPKRSRGHRGRRGGRGRSRRQKNQNNGQQASGDNSAAPAESGAAQVNTDNRPPPRETQPSPAPQAATNKPDGGNQTDSHHASVKESVHAVTSGTHQFGTAPVSPSFDSNINRPQPPAQMTASNDNPNGTQRNERQAQISGATANSETANQEK